VSERLPRPAWLDTPGGARLVAALDVAGGATKLVGGAVRDGLLGRVASDIDLATRFAPADTVARLTAAGIKAVPTGIAHGTVTAVADGIVAEVTTLRRDVATDGRHATVAFTDDWRADAARRDFTINALYADPLTGVVDDFFGGLADLAAHRVRFIGVPLERIAEDHLRILRFFRFHARFGVGPPDPAGLSACVARASDLATLSRERVRDELFKLLAVADPVPTVRAMTLHGILTSVLPEITASAVTSLYRLCVTEIATGIAGDPCRRLAALLPRDAAVLNAVATRLRLSNADRKRLVLTADIACSLAEMAYRDGLESAVDRGLLSQHNDLSQFITNWRKPVFALSGRDIIARGIAAGPEVSRILNQVEREWIAAGFPSDPTPILDQILS